jgi:hypothetical protein
MAVPYFLYELEEQIAKELANNTTFKAFCFNLLGQYCNIQIGEDYQSVEDDEYPMVLINASKQSWENDIDRKIEFSILLEVDNKLIVQDGYKTRPEAKRLEMIAREVYEIMRTKICADTPSYYYERDISIIEQKIARGSLEIVTTKSTTGARQW